MEADRFDTLARTLQVDRRRLDALARALGRHHSRRVTLAALLGLVAAAPHRAAAEQDGCNAERRRGETCTDKCQCRGDYRCGEPRPQEEREDCDQQQDAKQVCCLGQGDTCGDNDCACCGTMVCRNRRCRPNPCMVVSCLTGRCVSIPGNHGTECGPGQVCFYGECIGNTVCESGTDMQHLGCGPSGCGEVNEFPAQQDSWCRSTVEGGTVCVGRALPSTEIDYPRCTDTARCPRGRVCALRPGGDPNQDGLRCYPVCGSQG